MDSKAKWTITVLALSIAGASGCLGSSPKNEYFYYLKAPVAQRLKKGGPRLSVADFAAAPGFSTQRMAYRTEDNELRYYGYRQWVSSPPKLLASMVARHLRASRRFAEVERGERVKNPDAILDATIDAIEEVDQGDDAASAHLAMRFVLIDEASGKVIWRYAFDRTLAAGKRHPRAVARAMSKLLELEMRKIAQGVAERLRR